MTHIVQALMAFIATVSFSIIFNVPRKELVYCGLTGAVGWLFYETGTTGFPPVQTLIAAIAVTWLSRVLSFQRKMPIIVYLIPGIIPLVPGAGIYYTMFEILNGQNLAAISKGLETLKTAGSIAVGAIIVLSLPGRAFNISKWVIKKGQM